MNKIIISFCVLAICYGCKVNKEKSELLHVDTKAQSVFRANTSWIQLNRQDSTYRHWHYTGDSTFFFHPDVGLLGHSGQIIYTEQKKYETNEKQLLNQYDSLSTVNAKIQVDSYKIWTNYFMRNWIWFLLLLILTAVYWVSKKLKKT